MAKFHEDPDRTTTLGMARYGYEFLEAAFAVDSTVGHREGHEIIAPIPVLYLVGHSIELTLKAFLLHHGVTLKELRGFSHNLSASFERAVEFGLNEVVDFEEPQVVAFKILDELYSTKQLEYIETGAKQFPSFGPLELFAVKLFNAIGPIAGFNKQFHGYVKA
jgi:hypothetical protein